ncbi:MAG: tetratricopeptide repeat protein, partial [Candidatus Kapabacteria bacterium]|nr:tetratricopeptide repeat protein [Candidatus Kapabacteria bacterium]
KSKSSKINVFNKINRGIELKNKNNKPQLTGIESSNDSVKPYFFSFEIVDKSDEIITKQEKEKYKEKVSKGSYIEEVEKERNIDVAYVKTEIIVQLTLANASKFILDQKEYKMSIDWKKQSEPTEKNQRYILVLQKIVEQFLDDVVPKIDSKRTSMDISDENLQPIIDDVKKGDTKNSIEKLKKYILDNPNSAPANYNLALIFDYLKDYSNAMLYYNKACSIDPKYNQIKSECENRIQNLNDINSEH